MTTGFTRRQFFRISGGAAAMGITSLGIRGAEPPVDPPFKISLAEWSITGLK